MSNSSNTLFTTPVPNKKPISREPLGRLAPQYGKAAKIRGHIFQALVLKPSGSSTEQIAMKLLAMNNVQLKPNVQDVSQPAKEAIQPSKEATQEAKEANEAIQPSKEATQDASQAPASLDKSVMLMIKLAAIDEIKKIPVDSKLDYDAIVDYLLPRWESSQFAAIFRLFLDDFNLIEKMHSAHNNNINGLIQIATEPQLLKYFSRLGAAASSRSLLRNAIFGAIYRKFYQLLRVCLIHANSKVDYGILDVNVTINKREVFTPELGALFIELEDRLNTVVFSTHQIDAIREFYAKNGFKPQF